MQQTDTFQLACRSTFALGEGRKCREGNAQPSYTRPIIYMQANVASKHSGRELPLWAHPCHTLQPVCTIRHHPGMVSLTSFVRWLDACLVEGRSRSRWNRWGCCNNKNDNNNNDDDNNNNNRLHQPSLHMHVPAVILAFSNSCELRYSNKQ